MEGEPRSEPGPGATQGAQRRGTSEVVRDMRFRGQRSGVVESEGPYGFQARAQILPSEYMLQFNSPIFRLKRNRLNFSYFRVITLIFQNLFNQKF